MRHVDLDNSQKKLDKTMDIMEQSMDHNLENVTRLMNTLEKNIIK